TRACGGAAAPPRRRRAGMAAMKATARKASIGRIRTVARTTKETSIQLKLAVDGTGRAQVDTGVPFLDHMLDLFARHGLFDLDVACKGDLQIDDHHSVEDVAICLGQAFLKAVGDKAGIARYGMSLVPMDEALCRA